MNADTIVRRPHQSDLNGARYVLLVSRSHVKEVKSALEGVTRFDRYHGIAPDHSVEQRMRIPTTISVLDEDPSQTTPARLITELNLTHLSQDITLSSWTPPTNRNKYSLDAETNPLRRALREALQFLPPDIFRPPSLTIDGLVFSFPESYSVYKPLLLLPSTRLDSSWASFILVHASALEPVWNHVAAAFDCTHIALNSPIPPSNLDSSAHSRDKENILRSPVNLTPVYGSFGPAPTSQTLSAPTKQDFEDALWVQTTQNGIRQTWAPLYTMFSRGNVKEKARILNLPSVSDVVSSPSATGADGASAVDMYAGIGYFSFSYRRAGMSRVLCFELNPWSVEGLRRGAALNHWSARVFTADDLPVRGAADNEWRAWRDTVVSGAEDFLIFATSNEYAGAILRHLSPHDSPVRHVNLGLLPVSRLSWPSAVRIIDARLGGWVHVHENVGVVEMDERTNEVEIEFQRLADECYGAEGLKRVVRVEHVEKVKMYAPGVVHAVFDVYIRGMQGGS